MKKIYVKTVYDSNDYKLPNISIYYDKEDAESFVKMCLKWGIGIVSCEIISNEEAKKAFLSLNVEISEGEYDV